ncbi:NERD domain-containing protein [Roseofilum capinflatum]|uniref:NERD domain-containing protein n=1 Tax=Roseofilum capinflatum BLCC-M114 TaxID=3022440 RepID=A0ABT7BD98_9CYAN|nr:NERD domain-containing protein [Roseofilum capinflatum]MDJ1176481.1 NERD domain-containing protein [Roseofilum capinflatum BLCC-M114]
MVVKAYQTQRYTTTHENRIFDALLGKLEEVWGSSEEIVVLLGNFLCQGHEIDAAVLTKNSIIVIDFKDYGGLIEFSENGRWLADKIEIKGGNKPNPFIQIRDNKFALLRFLEKNSFTSGNQPNLGHISGLVIFHKPIKFDEKQLPSNIERWFHIVDFDRAVERLSQITSLEINLSNQDLEQILEKLSIPKYVPVRSGTKAVTSSIKGCDPEKIEWPDSLHHAISQVERFLASPEKIMIITGMIGTGIKQVLMATASLARKNGRNFTILAPNRRIALSYQEADSIYTYIYSANPKLDKEKFVYQLVENKETNNHLYIVSDAHLISDSIFETDDLRYGSGQLLTDFLNFSNIGDSERQIIFLGDPFQLIRGKADESALCNDRLQAITGFPVNEVYLDRILPDRENSLFIRNSLRLAQCMKEGVFNQLHIDTNTSQVIEAPSEPTSKYQVLDKIFTEDSKNTKFISFTHAKTNKINNWIRRNIFGRGSSISPGDIVHIHNSFYVRNDDDLDCPIYVSNNSFAEIIAVRHNIEPIVQPLKGRDQPVEVHFLKVQARLLHNFKEVKFLCLKNYLYADKPEVDKDTLVALYVSTKSKFDRNWKNSHSNHVEGSNAIYSVELAKFFRNDPYFNAARLRFGYALTLHRAQGQKFKTIVGDMDIGQGQTNEAYFRWSYTLFSIPQDKMILFNIPLITPFYKTTWDDSQGKLDSIRPRDLVAFDPDNEAGNTSVQNFSISDKALRNLYWHILNILKPRGVSICSYKHHNYQEVYGFESQNNKSCSLHFHYNGKYKITKIETVNSNPSEFANEVYYFLTSEIRLETNLQKKLFNLMKEKLDLQKISIQSVEHHKFQEIYYLKCEVNAAKLQVYYDGDGFITRIIPAVYTNLEITEKIRLALGV